MPSGRQYDALFVDAEGDPVAVENLDVFFRAGRCALAPRETDISIFSDRVSNQPATEAPVTESPTEAPVTGVPTETPVTSAPTKAPVTNSPTVTSVTDAQTEAPVTGTPTEAPVTNSPTEAPVTNSPTEAPVTGAPTEAPVTNSPTEAPVTGVPTETPVTSAPTQTPITDTPTEAPVTTSPTQAPVTKSPTIAPVMNRVTPAPVSSQDSCSVLLSREQTRPRGWRSRGRGRLIRGRRIVRWAYVRSSNKKAWGPEFRRFNSSHRNCLVPGSEWEIRASVRLRRALPDGSKVPATCVAQSRQEFEGCPAALLTFYGRNGRRVERIIYGYDGLSQWSVSGGFNQFVGRLTVPPDFTLSAEFVLVSLAFLG